MARRGAGWAAVMGGLSVWLLGVAAGTAILVGTGDARAGVAIGASPARTKPLRASAEGPYDISHADCTSDNNITFDVTITDFTGKTFQVWAGTQNCQLMTERQGTTATCLQLLSQTATKKDFPIEILAKKIVEFFPTITPSSCDDTNSDTGAHPVKLYFMLVDSSGADVPDTDAVLWDKTNVDVLGPTPPTGVKARAGESKLSVELTPTDASTNVAGYHFYCDHTGGAASGASASSASVGSGGASSATSGAGAAGGAGGAGGSGGTAGSGGAGATGAGSSSSSAAASGSGAAAADAGPSDCTPSVLVAGALTDPVWRARAADSASAEEKKTFPRYCGKTVGPSQVSGATDPVLENETAYAVAVAGYDKLNNIGRLSQPACATPTPVDDFWDLYQDSPHPDGGGCSCSLARSAGLPIPAGFAACGILAAALGWRRSRRPRRPQAIPGERA